MSNANQPIGSRLEVGQIIPAFTLPGADGMPHSPWDYKQREHLLLLFTRSSTIGETRGLLRAFAQQYAKLREEECAMLAISPDTVIVNLRAQEKLDLQFALLADPKGEVISSYLMHKNEARRVATRTPTPPNTTPVPTETKPPFLNRSLDYAPEWNERAQDSSLEALSLSIVLADRYGALYQQWVAESEADLPPIEELLESLRYLNKLCTP